MAEIATYTMIKTKTSYGSTGTECPPKKIIKAISSYISIANESSYGDNEAVKLEDISATAYTFTVANNSKSIGAAGGITSAVDFTSYKIVNGVQSNVSYSLTSTLPSWLTWDSSTRKFTVANNLGSSRIFTATFTQAESGKTVTASVTQAAVSQTYTFTVDGGASSSGVITKDGGESAAFNFVSTVTTNGTTANVAYSLTSTLPSWLTWDSVNRRFTATANTGVERTATATFTQTSSGKTVTITIVQGEGDIVYVFTANPTVITAASAAGNTNSISIVSTKTPPGGSVTNVSYSIATSTLPGWLTWNAGGMNFSVTSNTSSSSRTAQVQFVQSESGNNVTITVTQSGKTADAYVFTVDGSTSTTKTVSASGGNVTVSVVSTKNGTTQDWSITNISTDWLTAIKENSNVKLTASSNYTSTSRTGIITLTQSGSGKTATITVNQQVSNEWTYTFEPAESSKNKPTKVTTGCSIFGLDTTYTMYSYKQRSLNGIIVDETQVGVNVEYVVEYPSEHNCTIGSINADKTKWMIVLQLPTSLTTMYGTFTATQADSNKVFEINFMQVGDTDYRVGTYKLQKTSSSDTLWNGTDLTVYKEGSSDKTNGSQLFLSYVEINIDSDKITEQGYTLVSVTGTATSDRFIGRYSCPYRLRQSSTWFVSRFKSEDPYGRLYFIFPENTGASRSATVAIDQYIPSVEITGCEVYKNSPQTFSFTVTQHAAA